jgi:hypothetical protein
LLKYGPNFTELVIIYKASNLSYDKGYEALQEKFPTVYFLRETNFKQDVMDQNSKDKYTMFMVDDDIFYCPSPKIDRIDEIFKKEEDLCCFSLRLGLNTTVQDPHNRASLAELPAIRLDEDVFLWDHTTVGLNFGYPLSLDCHIFRTDFIFDLIKQIEFSSPNFLEGNLQKFSKECPPVCAAANSSSVFGAPINRVQNDFTNRAGLEFGMDPKALNKEFLKGKTLCPVIDKIVGAHQEVELKWES